MLSSNDGCIVARSQEVKDMGVPMGLPLFQAKQLVDMSKVTLFSSNFTLYRDISARVMHLLAEEVGRCDVYSIDEAFFALDESTTETDLAVLRQRIMRKTGIPVSIGVATTKTLAKVASGVGKKGGGVCRLDQARWLATAPHTTCGSIWGLGRATAAKLAGLGVKTAADFMALERRVVRKNFGVGGERIYDELHGTRIYELGEDAPHDRLSVMSTRSFQKTTNNLAELQSAIAYHVAHASAKIRERKLAATTMYLELRASRHSDFAHRRGGVEVSLESPTNDTMALTKLALAAVAEAHDPQVPYKKAGVILAGLIPEMYVSESLFATNITTPASVNKLLDTLQQRFGFNALHSAAILPSRDRGSAQLRSQAYTTAWKDIPTVRA